MTKKTFIPLLYSIVIIILLNNISSFIFYRLDLTSEKRFTLSEETKNVLEGIDDIIYIKVYLDGEFPSGFKRLQNKTKEMLQSFQKVAKEKIIFEFINPSESINSKDRNALYKQLIEQGLQPTDLQVKKQSGMSSSIIFPGAVVYYKEKHLPIHLLKNELGVLPEVALNNSIETLEYEFISTINKLSRNTKKKIAFLQGHGELTEREVADISFSLLKDNYSLSEYYDIEHFDISKFKKDTANKPDLSKQLQKIKTYKAIIIAKPTIAFNNLDKLLIDQYIVSGGSVLWLVDGINASMDSLKVLDGYFIATKNEINLDDMLFKYGIRINSDLIQDQRAVDIPIITGYSGNIPQQSFFKWPYHSLLLSDSEHYISKNLDAIKCEFVSSIDTIKNNIEKTILLHSSSHARISPSPHRVSLGILKNPPPAKYFNKTNIPIAVLLEGNFESIFKNRIIPKSKDLEFKRNGKISRMIVVSDGDIIRNEVSKRTANIFPLGYDKFREFTYSGNKHFIMNCMHYLCEDIALLSLKTKELKLRLLNKQKIQQYRGSIQTINILLPILIIILFGVIFNSIRKKKYVK